MGATMQQLIDSVFPLSADIRYVTVYRGGVGNVRVCL